MRKLMNTIYFVSIFIFSSQVLALGAGKVSNCENFVFAVHEDEFYIDESKPLTPDGKQNTDFMYHPWDFDRVSYYTDPQILAVNSSIGRLGKNLELHIKVSYDGKAIKVLKPMALGLEIYQGVLKEKTLEFHLVRLEKSLMQKFEMLSKSPMDLSISAKIGSKNLCTKKLILHPYTRHL